jgi:hypothetical protein
VSADWTYEKDGGTRHPVKPGQVWTVPDYGEQQAHLFTCADLMTSQSLILERHLNAVTLIYADPPWNTGNVNSFRTKAGLGRAEHSWLDIYHRILGLKPGIPAYLEGGVHQAPALVKALPGPVVKSWHVTYYRTKPSMLHYTGPEPPRVPDLTGFDDMLLPAAVLNSYRPGLVLDPCAGRGLTSRAAHEGGWRSVNSELHPNRLSAAMHQLALLTGTTPTRLS